MGYYLLDHPNPNGRHYYTSRRGPLLAIVVHVTAGLQDQDLQGVDISAEAAARYAASTVREVSWHSGSDSDSFVKLLPASYTAWHVHGYNSATYGHEISKLDVTWSDEPPRWVVATLEQAAAGLAPVARAYGIPVRQATRAELDRAIATGGPPVGFIGHEPLDPDRRRDPGRDFPWTRFLDLVRAALEGGMAEVDIIAAVERVRGQLGRDLRSVVRVLTTGEVDSTLINPAADPTQGWIADAVTLDEVSGQIAGITEPGPVVVQLAGDQLDQLAAKVAERLAAGMFRTSFELPPGAPAGE